MALEIRKEFAEQTSGQDAGETRNRVDRRFYNEANLFMHIEKNVTKKELVKRPISIFLSINSLNIFYGLLSS